MIDYCTQQPHLVNPLVVARLVALDAKVVSITCHAPSLEDVYASAVTGEGAPAAGTSTAGAPAEGGHDG